MNLRTIACWVVYNPKRRSIVNGFRTKKELLNHYGANVIPIGCVLVRMKGNYVPPRSTDRGNSRG